jgi:hypothetical protein
VSRARLRAETVTAGSAMLEQSAPVLGGHVVPFAIVHRGTSRR